MRRNKSNPKKAHCRHCTGNFGRCACDFGCPPKELTACSAVSKHCHHCSGCPGECSCDACPARPESLCTAAHTVSCRACRLPSIRGPRFKCLTCNQSTNLCLTCYYEKDHDNSHTFIKIERPGAEPVLMPAKGGQESLAGQGNSMQGESQQQLRQLSYDEKERLSFITSRFTESVSVAAAAAAAEAASAAEQQESSSHQPRSLRSDRSDTSQPPRVRTSESQLSDSSQQQQSPRQANDAGVQLSQVRTSTEPSNFQEQPVQATDASLLPVAEVVAQTVVAEPDTSSTSICNFGLGQVLRLQGLSKLNMNGRFGIVEAITSNEKVVLRIKGQTHPVVVSSRYLVEAFPVDIVVMLPDQRPGVVVSSGNKKVSVLVSEVGEITEWEPEQLTILEELE